MKTEIKNLIEKQPSRSAWNKGVKVYALELLESLEGSEVSHLALLNGASDWNEHSQGGCALIYDSEICERLATPSERKRKKEGELPPNSRESWLDCQARALGQAEQLIMRKVKRLTA